MSQQNYNQLKTVLNEMDSDMDKFYTKGVASAGSRIRKSLQEVKKLAQAIRIDIQETKKAAKSV